MEILKSNSEQLNKYETFNANEEIFKIEKSLIALLSLICIVLVTVNIVYFNLYQPLTSKEAIDFVVMTIGVSIFIATLVVTCNLLKMTLKNLMPWIFFSILVALLILAGCYINLYFGDEVLKLVINGIFRIIAVLALCLTLLYITLMMHANL